MLPATLKRYAWLSIVAALVTILLKGVAWWITGSVGLLSDALESFVNLAGALMALAMLSLAAQPADDNHAYGHGKAEYFSSAFEGFLIAVAAVLIAWQAVARLISPTRSATPKATFRSVLLPTPEGPIRRERRPASASRCTAKGPSSTCAAARTCRPPAA